MKNNACDTNLLDLIKKHKKKTSRSAGLQHPGNKNNKELHLIHYISNPSNKVPQKFIKSSIKVVWINKNHLGFMLGNNKDKLYKTNTKVTFMK